MNNKGIPILFYFALAHQAEGLFRMMFGLINPIQVSPSICYSFEGFLLYAEVAVKSS
jgi:hypothetical protein